MLRSNRCLRLTLASRAHPQLNAADGLLQMVAELKLAATVQDFEAMNSEVDELSNELEQRYVGIPSV